MQFSKYALLLIQTLIFIVILANPDYSQAEDESETWVNHNLGLVSFSLPPELISEPYQGLDSQIWKYTSRNLELTIDLGRYSSQTEADKLEYEYSEKSIVIDKKKETIVFFRFRDAKPKMLKYVVAVYFSNFVDSGDTELSFVVLCKSPAEQEIAEQIIRTIKFKEGESVPMG